jgi:O-antigen/teichoic acid export membrane protein
MYSVPLVVAGRLADDPKLEVAVGSAVGLTRLAMLVFFPLQAPLLPKLTAAVAHGRMSAVRRTTALLVSVCVVTSLLAIAGTGLFGPWVLRTIMGTKADLSAAFLMELSTGTLFLLVANALQSTLTALNRQQTVLLAWILGVVTMVAIFAVPLGVLTTAAVASIVGPVVTTIVMTADVLRTTGRLARQQPGPDGGTPARPQDRSLRRIVSSR